MALRTQEEMLAAFHEAGLEARFDPVGLNGRGIYVARVSMGPGTRETGAEGATGAAVPPEYPNGALSGD
jgi:hypothetical protein